MIYDHDGFIARYSLARLWETGDCSDVSILSSQDDRMAPVKAHKCILSASSCYLQDLVADSGATIVLAESPKIIKAMLRPLYGIKALDSGDDGESFWCRDWLALHAAAVKYRILPLEKAVTKGLLHYLRADIDEEHPTTAVIAIIDPRNKAGVTEAIRDQAHYLLVKTLIDDQDYKYSLWDDLVHDPDVLESMITWLAEGQSAREHGRNAWLDHIIAGLDKLSDDGWDTLAKSREAFEPIVLYLAETSARMRDVGAIQIEKTRDDEDESDQEASDEEVSD